MTELDFRLREVDGSYEIVPLTPRASDWIVDAAREGGLRTPLYIEHDGWLPVCLMLERYGFTVRIDE